MQIRNLKDVLVVDFRRSELTNYNLLVSETPSLRTMGSKDTVIFRNFAGDQLIFVLGVYTIINAEGNRFTYIRSERVRLLNGEKWDTSKVREYARQANIRLQNIEMLERRLDTLLKAMKKQLVTSISAVMPVPGTQRTLRLVA